MPTGPTQRRAPATSAKLPKSRRRDRPGRVRCASRLSRRLRGDRPGRPQQEAIALDAIMTPLLHSYASPQLDAVMWAITTLGSTLVVGPLFVIAEVALLRVKRRREALFLAIALIGSVIMNAADQARLPAAPAGPAVGQDAAGLQLPERPHDELARVLSRPGPRRLGHLGPARRDPGDDRCAHSWRSSSGSAGSISGPTTSATWSRGSSPAWPGCSSFRPGSMRAHGWNTGDGPAGAHPPPVAPV